MLVLSRRPGQRIVIGPDIYVEVRSVEGDRVRLGIVAPKTVVILREELRGTDAGAALEDRARFPPHVSGDDEIPF